ncbi:MAG: hypothetical protein ABR600_01330 [Actinomycetota bacterium]
MVVAGLLTACTSNDGSTGAPRTTAPNATTTEDQVRSWILEDRLQAELTIEDQPDWMAVGYGSIWVLVDEAAAIDRIDPSTNQVVAAIEVGTHPCNGLVAGFGSIWVQSCSEQKMYRISARRQAVEAVIDIPVFRSLPGTGPFGGIAAGAGALWMVTAGRDGAFDLLARIDPRTNKVKDRIELGHLGGGVAVGDGAVWVSAPEDGLLLRVNPVSGEVVEEIGGLAQPAWVAAGEGGVWVISSTWPDHPHADGSVTRVDPATNEVVSRIGIDEGPGEAAGITVGGGFVWVRTQYTLLAEIDPTLNTVVERYVDQKGLGDVDVGFGSVWLSDFAFMRVWRVPLA